MEIHDSSIGRHCTISRYHCTKFEDFSKKFFFPLFSSTKGERVAVIRRALPLLGLGERIVIARNSSSLGWITATERRLTSFQLNRYVFTVRPGIPVPRVPAN